MGGRAEVDTPAGGGVVDQLRHNHFIKKPLDDQLSSEIFEKYLSMLDGAKVYFIGLADCDTVSSSRRSPTSPR